MSQPILQVHPGDNVLVALQDLPAGITLAFGGADYTLAEDIPAKHKFTMQDLQPGDPVTMYGVLVGRAVRPIPRGARISTKNLQHASGDFALRERRTHWAPPDVTEWKQRQFLGYHRADGKVGTANHWLIVPMVFCENRNVEVLGEALMEALGYARPKRYHRYAQKLAEATKLGLPPESVSFDLAVEESGGARVFPHVDGIRLLRHHGGCGGTRSDAQALCGLLAGYITHPNVGGATVLSLGCQNAQVAMLQEEISRRNPQLQKPLYILEQQQYGTEEALLTEAIRLTFEGLRQANAVERRPAPIHKLVIGLECGGSDGFSGLSANPAVGYASDLLVACGGTVILSEFPELCGVEQELSDRCVDEATAERFIHLMKSYNARAEAAGSGFHMNPSPGNIRDGLITDAIKSAGAARKGGTSPVTDVLDYPEPVRKPGLNLLCTPGNDVESTTAEVGSGANIVLFTTGLGTPTGNPIAPVLKISSNTRLFERMPDIIDINTGTVIEGRETIQQAGERILEEVLQTASGLRQARAVANGQDDFIPWKRGVSL